MRKYLLLLLLPALFSTSCQSETQADEQVELMEELCSCVGNKKPDGSWDMHLSQECINLCMKVFGQELKGMDEWFRQHCGFDSSPKAHQEESKEVNI